MLARLDPGRSDPVSGCQTFVVPRLSLGVLNYGL